MMTYTPEASAEASRLVVQYGIRLLGAERSGDFANPAHPGRALQEMRDAAEPVLSFVAKLEERVKQLESWGVGGARVRRPFPPERTPEPDENERASEPTTPQPDEELPERADFADPAGGFAARRL